MKVKKKFLVGMLVAGLLLSGCSSEGAGKNGTDGASSKQEAGETIKLGNSAPLTGALSIYGITTNNGIKLAIDEINADGGILKKN